MKQEKTQKIVKWLAAHREARWFSVTARTTNKFMEDRIPSVAAGVTFFVLLALFPAIGALAAMYGSFGDRATLVKEISGLTG